MEEKTYVLAHPGEEIDEADEKSLAMADYVIERSVIGGWKVRKWKSGWVELWKRDTVSVDIKTASGTLYCSAELSASLPGGVLGSIENVDARPVGGSNYLLAAQVTSASATDGNFKYSLISSWSHTSENRTVWYHVVGWAK